jgi:predicted transcriptional regulator
VKLGIFETLTSEPMTATAIARKLDLDPALSYRLLRALASLGLLKEYTDRRFSLTETGVHLKSDHPQSLRDMALLNEGPENYAIWKHLPAMVRDGKQDGFVREFGESAFEYATHVPAYAEAFDNAMSSYSNVQTVWTLAAMQPRDFSSISHLCDVGGGQGHLLCHFLVQYPHLSGTVLERPTVLENAKKLWAERLNVGDRCTYVAGDMFTDVPSADAYLLKMMLHDWSDKESVAILQTIHRRAPTAGRVFIVEHVIPEEDTPHFSKLFDIDMMCWGPGRERTLKEYTDLLHSAGWDYVTIWSPPRGSISVIEGKKP